MDSRGNPQGEYGRFEQILTQFLLKGLHIILDSRIPSIRPYSRGGEVKKSDKWFSLVLGDRPAALDNLNFWHRNLMDPMIIDIILVRETANSSSEQNSCTASGLGLFVETVIERWVVQYEYSRTVQYEYSRTMTPQICDASYKKIYKKSIILLRSLYSMMRLLPAYKAFRKLCSSSEACDFNINYKVSSFSAPFSRMEEESMKQYSFTPIDAQQGRLSISVAYRESLSAFNLETSTSFPPEIITDYVGSPATDPFRAFSSAKKGDYTTSLTQRGMKTPTLTPFQHPHSWTSGLHMGAPLAKNQPFGGSPPAYPSSAMQYDLSSSPTDMLIDGHRIQNYKLPTHHKTTSYDDYQPSPPFSRSPSPSPPTYPFSGSPMLTRIHSETAPVSIPHQIMGRSPRYLSPNLSDPNRHSLPPLSPINTRHSPSQESLSGIRSSRISESVRAGDSNSGITNNYSGQKLYRDSKDDSGRFSGLLSSSGSSRIGFSRSSSRLSFQDDLDDFDFSCPFVVEDVDPTDSQASPHASPMARKSQDAAVGALVHMLRTAPPLCQDSSNYSSRSLKVEVGSSSSFFMPRKTSDALEDLRAYKEMKDLLLSKSSIRVVRNEES